MFLSPNDEQTIIENQKGVFVASAIESFLMDRKAAGLSPFSVKYYSSHLKHFLAFCDANTVQVLQAITPDFLRHYFLAYSEHHNAGGTHGTFRCLRVLFHWLNNEESMPPTQRNPMLKIKPPKVNLEPLEPVSLKDVRALIAACEHGTFSGERDRAILLFLLDTGARAKAECNVKLDDVNLNTGEVTIRYGKGGKSRTVFLGPITRRAVRAYLHEQKDPCPALFVSNGGGHVTYDGLHQLLERRWKRSGTARRPGLHDFRRAFALSMLRNGADVFSLQRLMSHADLQIMRRYLAQNDDDGQAAQMRGSPVDNGL